MHKQNDSAFQVLFFFFLTLTSANLKDSARARSLLSACEQSIHSTRTFPTKDRVTNTLFALAKVADLSWLDLFTYTHSFVDARTNKQLYEKYQNTKSSLSDTHITALVKSEWKERRRRAFSAMAKRACSVTKVDSELISLMQTFLFHIDDCEAFEHYEGVVKDLQIVEGFCNFNSRFREYFINILNKRLHEAKMNKQLKDMSMYWEFIVTSQLFEMKTEIKRVVFGVLELPLSSYGTETQRQARMNADSIEKLFDLDAFETAGEQMRLFEYILNNYTYYRLIPTLVKDHTDAIKVTEKQLHEMLMKYLDKSLNKQDPKSKGYMQTIFEDFGAVCGIDCVRKQGSEMRKKFYTHVTCFEISDIIAAVELTNTWTASGAAVFYSYIEERMRDDPTPFTRKAQFFCHAKSNMQHT